MMLCDLDQIPSSTLNKEGAFKTSKHQRVQVFLSKDEFLDLLESLGEFYIVEHSKVLSCNAKTLSNEELISRYQKYLDAIYKEEVSRDVLMSLSLAISGDCSSFYKIELPDQRCMVKQKMPALLLQPFSFHFDRENQEVFTGVHTEERIYFGVEISYPTIFQEPHSLETRFLLKEKDNQNTKIYKELTRRIRKMTVPTQLQINEKKKAFSFKIGVKQLLFAAKHPKLKKENLKLMSKA